jgi:exodeoxyribonuclease VII large subunit
MSDPAPGRRRANATPRAAKKPAKPAKPPAEDSDALPLFGSADAVGSAPPVPAEPAPPPEPVIPTVSVSEFTRRVKQAVEEAVPLAWVEGEISNFKPAPSGHVYFSLKDSGAVVSAVMWRSAASRLKFAPREGMAVMALGRASVYEPRGQFQLYVERLEPVGVGALELAFRQLCEKLRAEGLFDPARKRHPPLLPRRVALVTSPTGAAVRDMLRVFERRCPVVHVLIYPVKVQGEGAAAEIVAALDRINAQADRLGGLDAIIVGRGGGSVEDLWAFNEEAVARAIHRSAVPVVSAVGHEVDVTVADLVADLRAATPTAAVEMITPSLADLLARLDECRSRLAAALSGRAAAARRALEALARRRVFALPAAGLGLERRRQSLDELSDALDSAAETAVSARRDRLAALAGRLEALSPLRVLSRGYSLTQRAADGSVVRKPSDVSPGDRLRIRLAEGEISARAE